MTDLQQLLSDRLGQDLTKYLKNCMKQGLSCRKIAEALKDETGVHVSKSAVFNWVVDVTGSK